MNNHPHITTHPPSLHLLGQLGSRLPLLTAMILGYCALSLVARAGVPGANTMFGTGALASDINGDFNTAIGFNALNSNTNGFENTALGASALFSNIDGGSNTALGERALFSNTTGDDNTASGGDALFSNTTGDNNTAVGREALLLNTTGNNNTATGASALIHNTTGSNNMATGANALFGNTTGAYNTADGYKALYSNSSGVFNTAIGGNVLIHNTTSSYNTAVGLDALYFNTTGSSNTAEGFQALFRNTTGTSNIALGFGAGTNLTTGSSNIDIGNGGIAAEARTTRIGAAQTRAFVAGVRNAVVAGGIEVFVSASGQLGTNPSSKRFKEDIAAMDKKSEAILSLKPVTFRYKQELDPNKVAQFGLIAEEVAKVNPDLVARDEKGEIYSVRYEAVNAMLLNEFLKEHRKVEERETKDVKLEAIVAQQQKEIAALAAALKEQAAQIQKVRTEMSVQRPAARMVADNQ